MQAYRPDEYSLQSGGAVVLTASQAISLFGWREPLRAINWKLIVENAEFTFAKLLGVGLTPEQIYTIQPAKAAWLALDKITLDDLPHTGLWRVNPFTDLGSSIAHLAVSEVNFDALKNNGVTFDDMCRSGLSLQNLRLFKFSLVQWIALGMRKGFVKDISDQESMQLFQLLPAQLASSVPT